MQETVTVTVRGADREQAMLKAHALLTQWSDEYVVLSVDAFPVAEAYQDRRWKATVRAMVTA